jgi:hypothetical protein
MPKPSGSLLTDFEVLMASEKKPLSVSIPKMSWLNDKVDHDFIVYKLRLWVRQLIYYAMVGEKNVDVKEADFLEVKALIARRPELLGKYPLLNLLWKVIRLFMEESANKPEEVEGILDYFDTYAQGFAFSENLDLIDMVRAYCEIKRKEGADEFAELVSVTEIRYVALEFNRGRKLKETDYLGGNKFVNILVVGLEGLSVETLEKASGGFETGVEINSVQGWAVQFAKKYAKFLAPNRRKHYGRMASLIIAISVKDYPEVIKIGANLKVPDNDFINLSIKRGLFCAAYHLILRGTPAEKRMIRRRELTPDLIVEQMRKKVAHLRKKLPHLNPVLDRYAISCEVCRKLWQVRQMSEKRPLPEKGEALYQRSKQELFVLEAKHQNSLLKNWFREELVILP